MSEKTYQLVMQEGPKSGQAFDLVSGTMVIGRDALADIIIVDPEVSRQHVEIVETDSGHRLKDLDSTNGTFVNGRRLTDEAVDLEPGQEIRLGGSVVLRYQEATEAFMPPTLADEAEDAEPPLLLDWSDELDTGESPLTVDTIAFEDAAEVDESAYDLPTFLSPLSIDSEEEAEVDETDDDDWTVPELATEDIEAIFDETADSEPDIPEIDMIEPAAELDDSDLISHQPPEPDRMPEALDIPASPAKRDRPLVVPAPTRTRRNRTRIVLITAVFLFLCCLAFAAFMWFIAGDPLLELLGFELQ